MSRIEVLPAGHGNPKDSKAHQEYLKDVRRGKGLMQLQAVRHQLTKELHCQWSPRSFTPIDTPFGNFDAVVCNVSYHFHRHGQKYGNVRAFTLAAKSYYSQHKSSGEEEDGVLKLPKGTYEPDGRIITFFG